MTSPHRDPVWGLVIVLAIGCALAACGRTSLDLYEDGGPRSDSGLGDGGLGDGGGNDSGVDAGLDAGIDAAADSGLDSGIDAGRDAGSDSGIDAGSDSGIDSGTDAGRDSGRDAGPQCDFDCNDGIACTDDFCDAATGQCLFLPNSARCLRNEVCVAGRGCRTVPCRADEVCADGFFCNGVERCANGMCVAGSPVVCSDSDCQRQQCDESTRSCVATFVDNDGDGFPPFQCMGGDCDDRDPNISPRATEVCTDGRDNNCDFLTDCGDPTCRNHPACRVPPEICNNGIDDDRDGATDCADSDCVMAPNCVVRFEICNNGIDDDRDGAVDCFDPECAMAPNCLFRFEICNDRVDNDGDGAIDCADSDCVMDPACLMTPCPTRDLGSRVGAVARGNTSTFGNDSVPNCVAQGHTAPDVTFQWRAPTTGRWFVDTNGSNYDAVLYALNGSCNGPLIACNDDTFGLQAQLLLDLMAGQTIILVVDGYASSSGDYVLNINSDTQPTTERGLCNDGADNDNDGRIDCADPDCASDPVCQFPMTEAGQCRDFVDNDGDGAVDCDDSDCATDMACLVMPTCPDANLGSQVGSPVIADSTIGQRNDFTPVCIGSTNTASDVAYAWRAPQAGTWVFDTIGSNFDTALSILRGSCTGATLACDDDNGGNLASLITLTLGAGDNVVIVVDGWSSSVGNFVLNIRRTVSSEAGFCADFVDNDRDGATDCFDNDCAMDPACIQNCDPTESGLAACTDGIDNDCDNVTDCADSDCNAVIGSECCNGIDDNGDGFVDLFACACETRSDCSTSGGLPQTCWPRLGVCSVDCSAFPTAFGELICRRINPNWRCQRATGQCVPQP